MDILGPEESDHGGDEHGLEGVVCHGQAHQGGRVWGQEGGEVLPRVRDHGCF